MDLAESNDYVPAAFLTSLTTFGHFPKTQPQRPLQRDLPKQSERQSTWPPWINVSQFTLACTNFNGTLKSFLLLRSRPRSSDNDLGE